MEIKAKEIVQFPTNKLSQYPKIIQLIDFYGHRDPLIVDADVQPDGTQYPTKGCY